MNNMWLFRILKKTTNTDNIVEIEVEFKQNKTIFTKRFYASRGNFTRNWLENEIKKEIQEYENKELFDSEIIEGPFTLTPEPIAELPDPVPSKRPTQAELDFEAFGEKYFELQKAQKLVDLGIITPSTLDSLKEDVATLFKEEYIGKI